MLGNGQTFDYHFLRKVCPVLQHLIDELKHTFYGVVEPSFDQSCLPTVEHLVVKGDADILEHVECYKALLRAEVSAKRDDVGDAALPESVVGVQGEEANRHAEPFNHHLVVIQMCRPFGLGSEEVEDLVPELKGVYLLVGEFGFVRSIKLLVKGLCTNKVCILSIYRFRVGGQKLKRYRPRQLTLHESNDKMICSFFFDLRAPALDLVVVVHHRFAGYVVLQIGLHFSSKLNFVLSLSFKID